MSPEAAANLRAAFTLASADELRALVVNAGFRNVQVRIRSRLTRYPSLGEYVLGYLSETPRAGAVAELEETTRTDMVEYVCTSLQDYLDDDGMAVPWESHLVSAQV